MLTGSNNRALTEYKKVNQELVFFYQRWQEMLDSRTLDMYQYNILNSFCACAELIDVIEKTQSGLLTSRQNIDDIKAEAMEIVKNDDILEQYDKPIHSTLLRVISSKLDSKQRNEAIEDRSSAFYISLNRLKYQILAPTKRLKDKYLSYIISGLKHDIDSSAYIKTEKHMTQLISQCLYNGWSSRGLFILSEFLEGSKSKDEKWNIFANTISSIEHKSYIVYYSVNLQTHKGISADSAKSIIHSLDLSLCKGSDIEDESELLRTKLKTETNYIVLPILAHDIYSAALSAINLLNQKISIATFYNTISPWTASSPQIIVFDSQLQIAESLSKTDVFKTYDYIDSNNGVFEDTKNILNNTQKASAMNRLHAAFSYTNLSRSSYFQETKYISLWIAIESIMRTGQYADIISHIKLVLPEILCVRYIYRIMRNFSEDCMRCGFKYNTELGLQMFSENKKQLVRNLITCFRTPEKYIILKEHCKYNDLLQYRCQEIYLILTNTDTIKKKFEHYTQKVRWHVQRLYRLRNEITHSAFQENKSLIIYIEHLYTYLAQLMSELVYYIEHRRCNSVEESFSTILENYYTYMDLIKEGHLEIKDILPNGIIEFE